MSMNDCMTLLGYSITVFTLGLTVGIALTQNKK